MSLFGPNNEELDRCLTCNKTISNFTWRQNNGVCDSCPPLTQISDRFWPVIMRLAAQGFEAAQETAEKYMPLQEVKGENGHN